MVLAISKKNAFFFNLALWDFQGRSGRVLRGALGAPRASWEALGKLDQVQWGPFGRVLDRQKMSEVRILMEILG